MKIHSLSTSRLLSYVYPNHVWDLLRFKRAPASTHTKFESQLETLERVGKAKLGIVNLDDWYSVKKSDLEGTKFISVLHKQFRGSVPLAVTTMYPNHKWEMWRFATVPRGWWSEPKNIREFFDAKAVELQIEDYEQWYQRRYTDLEPEGTRFFTTLS